MPYDPELPGCFGDIDLIFANHPLDANHAFQWLIKLRDRQALCSEVVSQFEEFLTEKGADRSHIVEQVERARERLFPWLYGDE
jgi:hypothetical protein